MPDPLSAADRSSLQAERGPINMAVAGALVFEGSAGTEADAVAERLAGRLHLLPRYRQRLEEAPFGLAGPVWVDDDAFDLHWHLRHAKVKGRAGLADYMAREMSRKLDRSRPLWELHVVDGLEDGRTAVIPKMHHALVDGMAAIGIGMVLLDPTPEPLPIEPPAAEWTPRTEDRIRQLTRLAGLPMQRAQQLVVDSTLRALETSPRRAADDLRKAADLASELARQRPQAPMTPFNEPLTGNRRYAMHAVPLDTLKRAGKAAGGTVNDAVLASVTGMLGRYFDAAGFDLMGRDPVALVPVSVRREGDEGGNHISTVFVDLPVGIADPVQRMQSISAQMKKIRASAAVRAGALLVGATGQVPPIVSSMLVRAMGNVRAFNLVVSNLPGPQQAFYMNGARMLETYPAVPLNPANQRLTVGILSYDGQVCFGMLGDAKLDPGIHAVAAALAEAIDEVVSG